MAVEPKGHEPTDVNVRAVLTAAAALVVAALVISFVLVLQLRGLRARELPPPPPLAAAAPAAPPEPRLQTSPERDLAEVRAEEEAALGAYGWVDRGAGVVRVPIERGMELEAGR